MKVITNTDEVKSVEDDYVILWIITRYLGIQIHAEQNTELEAPLD